MCDGLSSFAILCERSAPIIRRRNARNLIASPLVVCICLWFDNIHYTTKDVVRLQPFLLWPSEVKKYRNYSWITFLDAATQQERRGKVISCRIVEHHLHYNVIELPPADRPRNEAVSWTVRFQPSLQRYVGTYGWTW